MELIKLNIHGSKMSYFKDIVLLIFKVLNWMIKNF